MDAFALIVDQIAERVAARLAATMVAENAPQLGAPAPADLLRSEIDPLRVYSAREVAHLLSVGRNSVYEIPRDQLPLVRRTGGNGYRGINVLLYSMGLPPVDEEALGLKLRDEFVGRYQAPPAVRAVSGGKVVSRVV